MTASAVFKHLLPFRDTQKPQDRLLQRLLEVFSKSPDYLLSQDSFALGAWFLTEQGGVTPASLLRKREYEAIIGLLKHVDYQPEYG